MRRRFLGVVRRVGEAETATKRVGNVLGAQTQKPRATDPFDRRVVYSPQVVAKMGPGDVEGVFLFESIRSGFVELEELQVRIVSARSHGITVEHEEQAVFLRTSSFLAALSAMNFFLASSNFLFWAGSLPRAALVSSPKMIALGPRNLSTNCGWFSRRARMEACHRVRNDKPGGI
jgi:hypothetical protein